MTKKFFIAAGLAVLVLAIASFVLAKWWAERERNEQLYYQREETELIVSNIMNARVALFKAGKNLADTAGVAAFNGERLWLPRGNYFLRAEHGENFFFIPAPIQGYRSGPDDGGAFLVTLRPLPRTYPPAFSPIRRNLFTFPAAVFFLAIVRIRASRITFGSRHILLIPSK